LLVLPVYFITASKRKDKGPKRSDFIDKSGDEDKTPVKRRILTDADREEIARNKLKRKPELIRRMLEHGVARFVKVSVTDHN